LQYPQLAAGIWTPRGYGYPANFTTGGAVASVAEETEISCIRNDDLSESVEGVNVDENDSNLAYFDVGINVPYIFDRGDNWVSGCNNGFTPSIRDAEYERDILLAYDIFVQTFREHYAFFELRGIDWEASSAEKRMQLTPESTDEELFVALASLIEPLEDRHSFLETPFDFVYSKSDPVTARLLEEAAMNGVDPDIYVNGQIAIWISILASYMEGGELSGEPFAGPIWGVFNGTNLGYIQMFDMGPEDNEAFAVLLDSVFLDLNTTDSIVIDLRINFGGGDTEATLLASYFATEKTLAYTQKAVNGESFTEPQDVFLEPAPGQVQYEGGVVVMFSDSCVSACETFALSMKQLPQVTFLGTNTAGAFSDILEKLLPNGWVFGLSNEVAEDPEGTSFERIGLSPNIVPDVKMLLPLEEREAGVDSWLELAKETALLHATKNATPTKAPTGSSSAGGSPALEIPTRLPSSDSTNQPSVSPTSKAWRQPGVYISVSLAIYASAWGAL